MPIIVHVVGWNGTTCTVGQKVWLDANGMRVFTDTGIQSIVPALAGETASAGLPRQPRAVAR